MTVYMPDPTIEEVQRLVDIIEPQIGAWQGIEIASSDARKLAALCRAYLAAHDLAAKPQMSAGEFAEALRLAFRCRAEICRNSGLSDEHKFWELHAQRELSEFCERKGINLQ